MNINTNKYSFLRGISPFFIFLCLVSLTYSGPNKVTILYEMFSNPTQMQLDWGFSALIEYNGKRILFDTGNDEKKFANNVKSMGVDLKNLDFAVISHRHADHSAGISHLEKANPGLKIYAPKEIAGPFGSHIPSTFYRKETSLPRYMQYFNGNPPKIINLGRAFTIGKFEMISETKEINQNMHLISLVSNHKGTKEMREISLAIKTDNGMILIVGCAHPGIENIVKEAKKIDPDIYLVMGGFHLLPHSDEQIVAIAKSFHNDIKIKHLAPGHCTGEPAFNIFKKVWGEEYIYAGLGEVIPLP